MVIKMMTMMMITTISIVIMITMMMMMMMMIYIFKVLPSAELPTSSSVPACVKILNPPAI
jgi:hypothetical protein